MNIFALHTDPKIAAQYHVDKHVISQMKEGVQMLCTALLHYDNPVPLNKSGDSYKEAYPNHPCTQWVIKGLLNYQWLWDLTYALCEEAEFRFGGTYHIASIMRDGSLPRDPTNYPRPATRTPMANATADWLKCGDMWDDSTSFKLLTIVDIYRLYYIMDKCHMTAPEMAEHNIHWKSAHTLGAAFDDTSIWTKRGAPEFMSDRFYAQQCDYFGIKPAELIHMGRYPDSPDAIKLKAKMERKMGKKATGQVGTKTKRRTKADVLVEIRELAECDKLDCLLKLTLEDMQQFKLALTTIDAESVPGMPTGRLKAPYVNECKEFFGKDIDFNKLTVAGLKELLQHFGAV